MKLKDILRDNELSPKKELNPVRLASINVVPTQNQTDSADSTETQHPQKILNFKELENFKNDGGIFQNALLPYIWCNETRQYETLVGIQQQLASLPASEDLKVHLGFSVWFNLDLIAATNPDYAIILDIDPKVSQVYKCLENSFKNSDNPAAFVEYFLNELCKENIITSEEKHFTENNANNELTKGYGFLCSTEAFLSIKSMCDQGKIFFGRADITNEEEMDKLFLWCNANNVRFNTLYLSNIPEWILENTPDIKQKAFRENIQKLIDKNTYIFDAFYLTKEKKFSGPPLRLTQGELPTYTKTVDKKKDVFFKGSSKVNRSLFNDDSPSNSSLPQGSNRKKRSIDEIIDNNPSKDMEGPPKK
jgi:hypothetical protein